MNNKPTVAISTDFLTAYAALPRQKQGKVTEFFNKFRNDPMHPGINFEKINEGIDKNICSVRIDDTYRGIVVREPESNVYILLWVDHHDEAYAWAKRKKCSINKLTGSVQIFDVQEVIEEQKAIDETALFANISDEVFEKIGLPEEQLPMIKAIKTLEGLHSLKAAIPEEAFEGLEWLGNGFSVEEVLDTLYPETEKVEVKENDFAAALQTDTSRKSFVIVEGEEELQAIMQEPLEKWRIFLHPTQRKVVEKNFNGPARVLGGAGTGKTVVAMHRAKMLASNLESNEKILFTTYTKNLAEDIKDNLRKICTAEEMKRIDIINLDAWVSNFLRRQGYEYQIVYDEEVDKAWRDAIAIAGGDLNFVENFYKDEWVKVVQAQEVYDKPFKKSKTEIGYEEFIEELRGERFDVDTKSLICTRRCSEEICSFIRDKLGIQIQSARINAGTVIRPSNIQEILDDKNIVKLVYDNASHYSFRAVNWSYSKGDTYDAVCVILNGSTEKLVEDKFSVSTLKTVTLNKLYVALTRSKGDLYIVTQDEFETVKEKYYK